MKYTKTDAGQLAFKQRSPQISARQRSLFILFDGNKTADQVLAATAGMGGCQADIDSLVENGFLALVPGSAKAAVAAVVAAPEATADVATPAGAASGRTDQERYLEGMKVATQITSALGLRGFRLNLSVEAAGNVKDLLELLPKIEAAAGADACKPLRAVLKG